MKISNPRLSALPVFPESPVTGGLPVGLPPPDDPPVEPPE